MKREKRFRWKNFYLVLLIVLLALAGCSGDDGATGATGAAGATGATGAAGGGGTTLGASAQDCQGCHTSNYYTWLGSVHGDSQQNGPELAGDVGHSPEFQIADEDCISCHSPLAVQANGGMTEADALGYFYTTAATAGVTSDGTSYDVGDFFPDTVPQHQSEWPNITCQTCHSKTQAMNAGSPSPVALALYDSRHLDASGAQGVEVPMALPSQLCGQCHGSLNPGNQATDDTFTPGPYNKWQKWAATDPTLAGNWKGTNHLLYDGWKLSKHSNTQNDPADELATEHAGEMPATVVASENCIACHAPTAVEANGGMTEAEALSYFYTTPGSGGTFDATTVAQNTDQWPNVDCVACHDQHNPGKLAYFNSSTKQHEPMASAEELCGQCHGNLRFADTDHLSYNILQGTGPDGNPAPGVADQKTMLGAATCTDCHMAVDSTTWPGEHHFNQYMTHGHTWQVIVNGGDKDHHPENHPGWTGWSMGAIAGDMADHGDGAGNGDAPHMASCTKCHAGMNAAPIITGFQSSFQALDTTTHTNVGSAVAAVAAMAGNSDPTLVADLAEAQSNLCYAEHDESGGFHNHNYLMALLNDANSKATTICADASTSCDSAVVVEPCP